jgi:riboflavin kinase/FMN adenylyltransferase
MLVFKSTDALPDIQNAVITIGTFDGVHQGHKTILDSVVQHARERKGTSVLITFDPHPRKLLFPDAPLKLLSTLEEKLEMVAQAGIDITVVVPFTRDFSELSPQDYICNFLVAKFHPVSIIIGYDHHFGHDRSGDIRMLQAFAPEYGFEVTEIPARLIDAAAISSTQIRKALTLGAVKDAAAMLGTCYSIQGVVVKGAQLGRTIGYPTANIKCFSADKLVPAIGVYAVYFLHNGTTYKGMMSIGTNPTVTEDLSIKMEVHIFDFNADIYGESVTVLFVERLRDELKFPSLDALVAQLHQDQVDSLAILA